jgi:trk system potassium uptake protein TrkH
MSETKRKIRLSPSLQIILGFMALILLGTFLLSLPIANRDGGWLNIVDSFFTSTSAVCVTGLIVVDTAVQFTLFGQIVIMLLIQIGGLGIVSITSLFFLILKKKFSFSNRLTLKESLNTDTVQGVVGFIKKVTITTFIIEGCGLLALLYSTITFTGSFWKGLFAAMFMSISSFCNAGFDVFGTETSQFMSLNAFASNVLMLLPIMMLIILGGIGFVVLTGGIKNIRTNQHIRVVVIVTLVLIFGGALAFMLAEWNNSMTIGDMSTGEKILNSFFQSVSTRTAGCATFDQGGLTTLGQIITIILMFIGGSPTSIAGGIKTTTLFVLFIFLIKKSNSNGTIVYRDRRFTSTMIFKAVKIVLYSMIVIII